MAHSSPQQGSSTRGVESACPSVGGGCCNRNPNVSNMSCQANGWAGFLRALMPCRVPCHTMSLFDRSNWTPGGRHSFSLAFSYAHSFIHALLNPEYSYVPTVIHPLAFCFSLSPRYNSTGSIERTERHVSHRDTNYSFTPKQRDPVHHGSISHSGLLTIRSSIRIYLSDLNCYLHRLLATCHAFGALAEPLPWRPI